MLAPGTKNVVMSMSSRLTVMPPRVRSTTVMSMFELPTFVISYVYNNGTTQSCTTLPTSHASSSSAPNESFKNKSTSPLVSNVTVCNNTPPLLRIVHVVDGGASTPTMLAMFGMDIVEPTSTVPAAITFALLPVSLHKMSTLPLDGIGALSVHVKKPPLAACVFSLSAQVSDVTRKRSISIDDPIEHWPMGRTRSSHGVLLPSFATQSIVAYNAMMM